MLETIQEGWQTFEWWTALIILVGYFFLDIFWTRWMLEVAKLRAARAAHFSALIYIVGAYGVLEYVKNPLYIVPLIIGAWTGTYFVVTREKRKKSREASP